MWIPDTHQLSTLILDCAQKNQDEHIDYYLNFGGEANLQDDDGRNAAHHFALKGNIKALDKIAADDISIFSVTDNAGMTPLMYLAETGKHDVMPYVELRAQLLVQTDGKGRSVAGFVAAHGDVETVLQKMLPTCPEIVHQKVIAMVMTSTHLKPTEKIKAVKALGLAGFKTTL